MERMEMTDQGAGKSRQVEPTDAEIRSVTEALDQTGVEAATFGMEQLRAAQGLASVSRQEAMRAASDITLAAAEFQVSTAAQALGAMAAIGAIVDMVQADRALLAAEDVDAMGRIVKSMSAEDLERALDLAAISGQLATVSDLAYGLEMTTLGSFLNISSRKLKGHAVESLVLMRGNRELARSMREVSEQLSGLGRTEAARAAVKIGLAESLQAKSEELADAAAGNVLRGLDEASISDTLGGASEALAREGIGNVAVGSGQIGAAIGAAEVARAPAKETEEETKETRRPADQAA